MHIIVLLCYSWLHSWHQCLVWRLKNLKTNSISKQVKRLCFTKEKALVSKSAKVFSVSQTAEDFPLSQTENKMNVDDFGPRTKNLKKIEELLTLFLLRIDSELVLHAPVWGSRWGLSCQTMLGRFIEWETSVYFCPLFVLFKTQLTLLTLSAMSIGPAGQIFLCDGKVKVNSI